LFCCKGKFDDGSDGSPLIILKSITNTPSQYKDARVYCIFIEKKYFKELEANIASFPLTGVFPKVEVLKGTFEENIDNLLQRIDKCYNVFFYVDPYGHKSLDFKRFQRIKNKGFNSVELLINFNTNGFFREGCRLLKIGVENLIPAGFEYEIDEDNNINNMNSIANGDYWIKILMDYKKGKITAHEFEEQFIINYTNALKKLFNYSINIPIKLKTKNMPKYRLIFCTDHPDGIFLMADNMNKKWGEIVLKERCGQLCLFDFDYPGGFSGEKVRSLIDKELKLQKSCFELKSLLFMFIERYGLPMAPRIVKTELRKMEQMGSIEVRRDPPLTKTGKLTKSFDHKNFNIKVRTKQ
jgi:three-Cys-motif partner protein